MLLQEKSGNHQNDRDLSSGDHECLSKIQKFFIVVIVVDILVWTEEVDWLNEWHCHALGDAIRKANSKAKDYPVKTKHYPIVEETTWTLGTNVNSPFLSWAMKLLSIFPMWKDFFTRKSSKSSNTKFFVRQLCIIKWTSYPDRWPQWP